MIRIKDDQLIEGFSMYSLVFLLTSILSVCVYSQEITLTREQCSQLLNIYKPDPSISYQPNVDVNGKKLVPVDVNNPSAFYSLGEEVTINLESSLKPLIPSFSPQPPVGNTDYVNPVLKRSEVQLGTIHIQKDGKVIINGTKVEDAEQAKIETYCRQQFPDL